MYTLENCEKLWREAVRYGTAEERIACTKRWEPYYSYLAEKASFSEVQQEQPFVTHLVQEGVLAPDTTLLDIGAGMGTYALLFAKVCREVTALEPVEVCLRVLRDKAARQEIANIQTVRDFWERFQPEKTYDVTFASMCPAICNIEELRRMEAITNRTCCLVAVQRGSYDLHRKAMMAGLQVKPQGGMTTEAIHYINALYLMGRQPNVKFLEFRRKTKVPAERVLEQYPIYFEIFGISRERSVTYLENYLAEHATDGYLNDESYLRQALIWWHKP